MQHAHNFIRFGNCSAALTSTTQNRVQLSQWNQTKSTDPIIFPWMATEWFEINFTLFHWWYLQIFKIIGNYFHTHTLKKKVRTCTVDSDSARGIQLGHVWQCYSQIIHTWYFSLQLFSICTIFINRFHMWTIYGLWGENEVSKCRWENSTKVCVKCHQTRARF